MPSIKVVSLPDGSIGEITNDLLPLLNKDFEEGEDILLMHYINFERFDYKTFNNYKKKVLIQPIDGHIMEPKWVNWINKFDIIITHATVSKEIMIENGVNKPIHVIPLYLKEQSIPDTSSKEKIIFYSESNLSYRRKGIDLIYEGFKAANLKNAELILKIKTVRKFKNTDNITVINDFLPYDELKSMWSKSNIYLSASRIEGFGIPIHRFFNYNKRIVVLENKFSGYNDFLLGEDGVYFIPSNGIKSKETVNPHHLYTKDDDGFANANIEDVAKIIQQAYYDELVLRPFERNAKALTLEEFYQELKTILTT